MAKSARMYPVYMPKSGTPVNFAYFFRSAWNVLVAASLSSTGLLPSEKTTRSTGSDFAAGESRKSCP